MMPRSTMSDARDSADGEAVEADRVRRGREEAGDRFEEGRFAGAVGADDRHRLTGFERKADAEQRLEVAVEGGEVAGLEERHHASIPR